MADGLRPVSSPSAARLRLGPPSTLPRRIDGAWWPRSRALLAELPPLIDALPAAWGEVAEVKVHGAMWFASAVTVHVAGHGVRVHRLAGSRDRHVIRLSSTGCGWQALLVVPPEIDEYDAERLMAAAAALSG